MKTCKIKSIKSLGLKKTYSLTMESHQHNYFIYDKFVNAMVPTMNSHSAAYSLLAYQICYLKVKHPFEFMCSLLTSEIHNNDKNLKLNNYIEEANRMGLIILGPDINKSKDIYTIERQYNAEGKYRDIIRTPLTVLKGVAGKATEEIISLQPFEDLKQFISKIDGRKVNKKVFEALAESGCLSACWKSSPEQLMSDFEILKAEVDKEKKSQKKYDDYVESLGGESIFDIDIGDGFSM